MERQARHFVTGMIASAVLLALSAQANTVQVQEVGIGANEIVRIDSSTLGNNLSVYAGIVEVKVNGVSMDSFCIDPYHWSASGVQTYTVKPLSDAPKSPGGPMGTAVAKKIEQLWAEYYSHSMSDSDAAGLQIAIWDLIGGDGAGGTFSLASGNDYGASAMLAWLGSNPDAPTADLNAISGSGQDYVLDKVPDGGTTGLLLGLALGGLALARRKPGPAPLQGWS